MELSGSPSSSNHSVVTAAQPNRGFAADATRTNPQPLAPAKPRPGNKLRKPLSPASDAVSSTIFLLNMAANFEVQGNFPESVKSAETALLLRKSKSALIEPMLSRNPDLTHPPPASKGRREASIPASISEQARDLVLRCNSFAVSEFTQQHYDAATFFLDKALFLTDSGSDKTPTDLTRSVQKMLALSAATCTTTENTSLAVAEEVWMSSCFTGVEEERLRLRAATYNNLGCMERRRGRQEPSLDYLRKAIQIEMRLDPSGSASASTYLNLCTVLNEMGKHAEAAVACERAITALQLNMIEEASAPRLARYAKMLAVAQYNLGASVERRDPNGDKAEAEKAYRLALSTCHRYHLVDPDCNSVDEAFETIKHMKKPPEWALLQPQEPPQMLGSPPKQQSRPAKSSPLKLQPLAPLPPPKVTSTLRSWEAEVSAATPFSLHSGQHSQHSDDLAPDKNRVAEPRSRPTPPVPAVAHVQSPKSQPPQAALTLLELPSTAPPIHPVHTWAPEKEATSLGSQPPVPTPVAGMLCTHPSPSPHSPLAATLRKHAPRPRLASAGTVSQPHSPHTPPSRVNSQRNSTWSGSLSSLLRPGRAVLQPPPTLDPMPPPSPTSTEVRKLPLLGIPPEKLNESYPLTQTDTPFGPTAQIALPTIIACQSVALANTPPRLSFVGPLKVSTERLRRNSKDHSLSYSNVTLANALGRRTFGSTSGGIVSLSNNKLLPARLASESNASASLSLGSRQAIKEQQRQSIAREQRRQERKRRQEQKRQEKLISEENSNLADELYEQMVSGMKQVELRRCQEAAVEIQRMWRGVMARSWIRTMMSAAERLQRVVRKFLVKVREERRLLEEERQRRLAEQRRRELKACRVIQARTRQFLHRLEICRQYLAHQRRNFMAARVIQRGYRDYYRRRALVIAAEAKQSRWEDELRRFRLKVAAQRIQMAYRSYRQHLAELAAIEEKRRRDGAATKVQALIRGFLTRAWFTYYRAYTRDQELRSAANQRRIVVIQTACRAVISAKYCTEVRMQRIIEERQRRLNQAAMHIQCMWRQRVAFIKLERLRAEHDRDMRLATVIQRWYRSRKQRKWFLLVCEENRREKAAGKIQHWARHLWVARKEKAFAAYHVEKLREMRLFRLRQESILVMQACTLAKMSARIVGSMRAAFEEQEATAKEWQRICRGYLARVGLGLQKEATHRLYLHELTLATQTVAARILQRAWRCMKSKMIVEQMRREIAAGTVIARSYRVYRAKCALHELRAAKREKAADGAARCIQLCVRGFLKTRRLQEMEAYYRTEQAKKMVHLRRVEATTMIQSLWRGYVTRKALEGVREEHRRLCWEATRLQRMWRRRTLRRTMQLEMARRVEARMVKSAAALTIQCFWRKMMSAEYTARLRADRAVLTEKVQALQRWWRQQRAKRLLARLRQAAADEDALAAHYALLWERSATLVNCALRVRQSQLHAQLTLFDSLLNKLSLEKRIRFELRDRAATKIQALYHGYVERIYARGLLREKKDNDRIAAERAARETTATSRIQCAYRRHAARQEVHRRRTARREAALAEDEFIATADSHQIVRELFWANSALTARDATAERLARINKLEASARTIQRAVRYWRATTTATARARQMRCERAALCIQNYWRQYLGRKEGLAAQRREQAAITIQCNARGWLVRREWGAWRTAMASQRHKRVELEDALDHAVIVIQSCWRRVVSRRRANALRQERDARKHAQKLEDAAFIIQDAFHGSRRKSCHGVR